jgi:hypothetical protein
MPFGLKNAPSVFCNLVLKITEMMVAENPTLAQNILLYFDDACIVASTFTEFLDSLKLFLSTLRKTKLKINLAKCSIGLDKIKWLGHLISDKGIEPDPSSTATITNWPPPNNI